MPVTATALPVPMFFVSKVPVALALTVSEPWMLLIATWEMFATRIAS